MKEDFEPSLGHYEAGFLLHPVRSEFCQWDERTFAGVLDQLLCREGLVEQAEGGDMDAVGEGRLNSILDDFNPLLCRV